MKKSILLILMFVFTGTFAQKTVTYKCYNLENTNKTKLQLKFYAYTAASAKYAGQKQAIPLQYVSGSDKADAVFYNEVYNGKVTGSYEIQEDVFLLYHPKKEHKTYTYTLNEEKSFKPNSDKLRTTPCF